MARPIKRSSLFCGPVNNQKRCGTRKTPRQVGRLSSAKRKFREQLPPPRRCFEPCAEGTAVQSRLGKGHAPVRWKLACTNSVVTLSWRAKFALHRIERSRSSRAGAAIAGANWSSEPKNLGIFGAGRFRSFRRKRIVPRSRLEVPVAGCQPSPENTGISENLNPGSPEDLSTRIDHHQGVETLDRLFPNQTAQPNSMITE